MYAVCPLHSRRRPEVRRHHASVRPYGQWAAPEGQGDPEVHAERTTKHATNNLSLHAANCAALENPNGNTNFTAFNYSFSTAIFFSNRATVGTSDHAALIAALVAAVMSSVLPAFCVAHDTADELSYDAAVFTTVVKTDDAAECDAVDAAE